MPVLNLKSAVSQSQFYPEYLEEEREEKEGNFYSQKAIHRTQICKL